MGGLLYKDFVSIDRVGKLRVTWILTAFTLLYIALRMAFPGTLDRSDFLIIDAEGEIVNLIDAFFFAAFACQLIISLTLVSVDKIMGSDEKNKIKEYLSAMPIGKHTYVASKYIFIVAATYVIYSLDYIWGVTCIAFCRGGQLQDMAITLASFIPTAVSLVLLLATFEIPLYIYFGKEKAKRVRVMFWTLIAFVAIGFVMFGDITSMSNLDLFVIMEWVEKHNTGIVIFQNMTPVIVLIFYYLSYRFSGYLYHKKECEN